MIHDWIDHLEDTEQVRSIREILTQQKMAVL